MIWLILSWSELEETSSGLFPQLRSARGDCRNGKKEERLGLSEEKLFFLSLVSRGFAACPSRVLSVYCESKEK